MACVLLYLSVHNMQRSEHVYEHNLDLKSFEFFCGKLFENGINGKISKIPLGKSDAFFSVQ